MKEVVKSVRRKTGEKCTFSSWNRDGKRAAAKAQGRDWEEEKELPRRARKKGKVKRNIS